MHGRHKTDSFLFVLEAFHTREVSQRLVAWCHLDLLENHWFYTLLGPPMGPLGMPLGPLGASLGLLRRGTERPRAFRGSQFAFLLIQFLTHPEGWFDPRHGASEASGVQPRANVCTMGVGPSTCF